MADEDILALNQLIRDYGTEYRSPDRLRMPMRERLYAGYTPATGTEQAEMILSMVPYVGEGLDAAHIAQDIGKGNYTDAGLSGFAMLLPGVGAGVIKKIGKNLPKHKQGLRSINIDDELFKDVLKTPEGDPVILYRGSGIEDSVSDAVLSGKSRDNYATFMSDSPYVAETYAPRDNIFPDEVGVVTPFVVKPKKLIEYEDKYTRQNKVKPGSTLSFDRFEFDRQAQNLGPEEVLVVRGVHDAGPHAVVTGPDDPQYFSHASDVYATKDPSVLHSPFSTKEVPDQIPNAGTVKKIAKKLEIDNPGGSWLRNKKEEAAEAMAKARPNTYRKNLGTTAITGYHEGVIELDPKQLADVPGAMGEEASRTSGQKLADLQKSIQEEGYNPSPILIHVREDGKPFIVEGNTRVAEAIISDRPSIQAEIRYLRGAEEVEGPLSPDKIFEMPDRAKSKLGEFREGPPIKIGDTMQPSLLTSDGEPPEVLYRIVSRKEFDKAQESGKFDPSSFYGRIHASSSPDMRYKNAPDDVVIEIKYDPDDGWYSKQSSDEVYGVTKKDIPISRTRKIKQFKKGGSVVERSNNYEPKAI